MRIAKKYLLFSGLGRKKVGLTRVRIAKKIHSSLLPGTTPYRGECLKGCLPRIDKGGFSCIHISANASLFDPLSNSWLVFQDPFDKN